MKKYFPNNFESRWADQWLFDGLFQRSYQQVNITNENKMYLLYAFAYPSGSGLHVGHVEPVTALDILARYYRSIGKKVFFPVGWDAFGLPAENYAVKTGISPVKTTKDAIDNFRKQIKRIGISYDWETEIATCHPGYYKWTQWLFLQLYKKGLVYKKKASVNWCPSCQTVLANEQVVEGKCERCGTEVIQKEMEQWFFKITNYKNELISGLDTVDWPKATKLQQLNWIGKSEGVRIKFTITNDKLRNKNIEIFTTAHDTIFGATFIVVAPEHELVLQFQTKEVKEYVVKAQSKTEEERMINKEKTGIFSGYYAIHPMTQKEIPIWVADYVLVQYGTGAIMAVPGNDERDFQFAKKYDLPIVFVAQKQGSNKKGFMSFSKEIKLNPEKYTLIHSGEFNGQNYIDGRENILLKLEKMGVGTREVSYKLRDWLISRQRYWGAPIPIVYDPEGEPHMVKEAHLPWMLPTDVDFKPTGESPLKLSKEFNERVEKLYGKGWKPEYDTMDTFVDSSWYYLRYADPRNKNQFAQTKNLQKWMPVDFYMIGPEHIVLHLLYSRFFTKFLRDEGYINIDEPFTKMRHQGMILGPNNRKMSKSKGNVINPDEIIEEYGADTLRMYEMFMGPIDADKPWSQTSVQGLYRFLKRVWNLYQTIEHVTLNMKQEIINKKHVKAYQESQNISVKKKQLIAALHKTIKKVGEDIEALKFNTAIAAMMQFLNMWEESFSSLHVNKFMGLNQESIKNNVLARESVNKITVLTLEDSKMFLKILSPFAPFLTEEIWRNVFNEPKSIHLQKWPNVNESILQVSMVTIPVQVNGKLRDTIVISVDDSKESVIAKALHSTKVQKYLNEMKYKNAIYIQGKILNIIV